MCIIGFLQRFINSVKKEVFLGIVLNNIDVNK